jgi:hypothetical protein
VKSTAPHKKAQAASDLQRFPIQGCVRSFSLLPSPDFIGAVLGGEIRRRAVEASACVAPPFYDKAGLLLSRCFTVELAAICQCLNIFSQPISKSSLKHGAPMAAQRHDE